MQKIHVGMIGAGFMGQAHSLAYSLIPGAPHSDGVGAVKHTLVDVVPAAARARAEELGWAHYSSDLDEVLQNEQIDVIDICTPPQFHEEIAERALNAGKHVFCEKPIANDLASAQRMAAQAAAHPELKTQVGFNYRHAPAIKFAQQLVQEGKLGAILQVRATYTQDTGFGADPERWRARKVTGGSGMVGDIGSHIIDLATLLAGPISRVSASVRSFDPGGRWHAESTRRGEDLVEDGGVWLAEFRDGAIGTFAATSVSAGSKNRILLEIDGAEGSLQFNWNTRDQLAVAYVSRDLDAQGYTTVHLDARHPGGWWRVGGMGTGYIEVAAAQMQSFLRAIAHDTATDPDFHAAARVQEVVEAVHYAAIHGSWKDIETRRSA